MKTILLVNNDKTVICSLEALLRRCRYGVIATCDGSAAMGEIESEGRIDLVISDHQLIGMEELAILKALRQTRPAVPAIILTERGTLSSYLKAIGLGVTAYLENSVGTRELLRRVADVLGDSAEEKSGSTSAHACREAGTQTGGTVYDRGYADVIQF